MLILAIFAFLSLRIQPLFTYIIEMTPLIDNLPLNDKIWTLILNLACVGAWYGLGVWFMWLSRTECDYDVMKKSKRPSNLRLGIAAAISGIFVSLMIIFAGGFSFPYKILNLLDVVYTVFYYFFIAVNAAMIVLVITFGQKFGDLAFGGKTIPWGGIVLGAGLALTNLIMGFTYLDGGSPWEVVLSAAIVFAYALIYGAIYVVLEKKPIFAYPFVAFIFILL